MSNSTLINKLVQRPPLINNRSHSNQIALQNTKLKSEHAKLREFVSQQLEKMEQAINYSSSFPRSSIDDFNNAAEEIAKATGKNIETIKQHYLTKPENNDFAQLYLNSVTQCTSKDGKTKIYIADPPGSESICELEDLLCRPAYDEQMSVRGKLALKAPSGIQPNITQVNNVIDYLRNNGIDDVYCHNLADSVGTLSQNQNPNPVEMPLIGNDKKNYTNLDLAVSTSRGDYSQVMQFYMLLSMTSIMQNVPAQYPKGPDTPTVDGGSHFNYDKVYLALEIILPTLFSLGLIWGITKYKQWCCYKPDTPDSQFMSKYKEFNKELKKIAKQSTTTNTYGEALLMSNVTQKCDTIISEMEGIRSTTAEVKRDEKILECKSALDVVRKQSNYNALGSSSTSAKPPSRGRGGHRGGANGRGRGGIGMPKSSSYTHLQSPRSPTSAAIPAALALPSSQTSSTGDSDEKKGSQSAASA